MNWYAIHTYSGHENKVKSNLEKAIITSGMEDRFGRVLVPTQLVTEMKNGKKTQSTRKFFPSYIIIEMDLDEDTWHVVRNCPGVSRFVAGYAKLAIPRLLYANPRLIRSPVAVFSTSSAPCEL